MASYTIKSGDTLSKIARDNNTTVADLQKANPSITNPNLIYAGNTINIPDAVNPPAVNTNTNTNTAPTTSPPPTQSTPQAPTVDYSQYSYDPSSDAAYMQALSMLESVQQGMLKLLEGADVEVPVGATNKNAMVPMTTVNTRNILFICGGAFPDLSEIIKQRLNKQTSIGFGAELKDKYDKEKNILDRVTVEDLRKFGMIPEFIGRLPVIYTLQGLTKEMLIQILKEPKNAILKQYQKLLELDEVKLEFDDSALEAIAEKALEKDTGARALRAIIEEFMLDIMYEIPKDDNIGQVTITRAYIEGTGGPIIDIRNNSVGIEERKRLNEIRE